MPSETSPPERPHYEVHLTEVRDLFIAPDDDPFDPHFLDVSGVDELVNLMTPTNLRVLPRIVVYLPPDRLTPGLEAETREALHRYLQRRRRWSENEVRAIRRSGWQTLIYAVLLCAAVLALLVLVYLLALPQWVQAIAYAVFIVVGWVSLWWAVETLLFDWLEGRRLARVLDLIDRAQVEVRPEPPRPSPEGEPTLPG
jgi:hypothetical protein